MGTYTFPKVPQYNNDFLDSLSYMRGDEFRDIRPKINLNALVNALNTGSIRGVRTVRLEAEEAHKLYDLINDLAEDNARLRDLVDTLEGRTNRLSFIK